MRCYSIGVRVSASTKMLFTVVMPLGPRRFSCSDQGALGARRGVIASPEMNLNVHESGFGEHLLERPPPYGTRDSVRPLAFVGNFIGRHVVVMKNICH